MATANEILASLIREANPSDAGIVGLSADATVDACSHNLAPEHYRLAESAANGRISAIVELRKMMGLSVFR